MAGTFTIHTMTARMVESTTGMATIGMHGTQTRIWDIGRLIIRHMVTKNLMGITGITMLQETPAITNSHNICGLGDTMDMYTRHSIITTLQLPHTIRIKQTMVLPHRTNLRHITMVIQDIMDPVTLITQTRVLQTQMDILQAEQVEQVELRHQR
jgi:hypothetical protein